jgi:hypothetical protein
MEPPEVLEEWGIGPPVAPGEVDEATKLQSGPLLTQQLGAKGSGEPRRLTIDTSRSLRSYVPAGMRLMHRRLEIRLARRVSRRRETPAQ